MKKEYSATKSVCKVTFNLPKEAAPEAKSVVLLGEFNDWAPAKAIALKSTKDGFFSTKLDLEVGKDYEFRYLIDDQRWENDWEADKYVPSPFGVENSVVSIPAIAETKAVLKPKTKKASTKKSEAKKAESKKETKSSKTTKTKKITENDLKKIEGIGPKISQILIDAGIGTWLKLSQTPTDTLKDILSSAGSRYKSFDPSTWAEQASLAHKKEWDKLDVLQKELRGGRR